MKKKLAINYDANNQVSYIIDLSKVSFVSKYRDATIKIIIDGCMQNFDYASVSERDSAFDYLAKRMQEDNE